MFIYMATVFDLFSGRLLGWSVAELVAICMAAFVGSNG